MELRNLTAIVTYTARSLSAAALMIWGVFNIAALAIQFSKRPEGDIGNWTISALMCAIFGLLPFVVGAWLLYRNIASTSKPSTEKESKPVA